MIDTETPAETLVNIYSCLGIPEEVLSDRGAQFLFDGMKEVCKRLGVQHHVFPSNVQRPGVEVQWHIEEDAEETLQRTTKDVALLHQCPTFCL